MKKIIYKGFIKQSEIPTVYDVKNYSSNGFYLFQPFESVSEEIEVIVVLDSFVWNLGGQKDFEKIIRGFLDDQKEQIEPIRPGLFFEPIPDQKEENKLSEDFALKLLSIALNKEKFKDINI